MEHKKFSKALRFCILTTISIFTLSGCSSGGDITDRLNKAIYNDVIPTPENILDFAVAGKNYTINDLGLTTDEKNAIKYYKDNPIRFVDTPFLASDEYINYENENYSISNQAYDIRLIEEFFDLKIETVTVDTTSEVLSTISSGDADIISEFVYSDNRAEYIDFVSTPSVDRPKYYYSSSDSNNAFIELLKLNEVDRVVGVDDEYSEISSEFIEAYGLQINVYTTPSAAFSDMENGVIKGYISGEIDNKFYSKYNVTDITRYNTNKTYSVAYAKNNEQLEHLANAVSKLLTIDSRQNYNELKRKLHITMGTYLTDEEISAITNYDNAPLKVEMQVASFPDSYIDSNGKWAGIAVDSFEYRAKLLGLNYEIVTPDDSTFENILDNLGQNGNAPSSDVAAGIWYTNERTEFLDFADPLTEVNFLLVGREDSEDVTTLDEISALEIGITKDYGYKDIVLDLSFSPYKEYIEFDTEKELIEAYINGDVEYFMIAERHLELYKAQYKLYDIDVKYAFEDNTYLTYGFSKSLYSEYLVSAFNKVGEIDSVTRYIENYDISPSIATIIELENRIATRNVLFVTFAILLISSLVISVQFYRKKVASKKEARTDKLTEIGNRRAFFEDGGNIDLSDYKIAYVDLSNFKTANDVYGHHIGDLILKVVARRLNNINKDAKAYRIGGDEFVVLAKASAQIDLDRAIAKVSEPIHEKTEISNITQLQQNSSSSIYDYKITFACGVMDLSKFPDFNDLDVVLKYVDLAMYDAKKNSDNSSSFVVVNEDFMKKFDRMKEIEFEVVSRKMKDIFCPVFQPLLDVKSGKIVGYETLVRYKSDLKLSPPQFLQVVKNCGKLKDLDLFIFEESICLLNELISTKILPKDALASSNFGPLTMSGIRIEEVDSILNKYNITKDNIYIEISEESILSVDTLLNIHKLKDGGYKLAIDDFTAGNSSLSFLSELDVEIVKLDQQLLKANSDNYSSNDRHMIIYDSVTELSKKLGFKIVSEGVETKKQLDIISNFNVDIAQGYYIARPLIKDDLIELIKKTNEK